MSDDLHISAVSETLFLPLYALALESQRSNPIMVDQGAVELTHELNEHFRCSDRRLFRRLAKGRLPSTLLTTVTLRIRAFDRYARAFLEREPAGIVVSLGCGLDDRRRRVDNGTMRWFDLDLPEVIQLRRRFLAEDDRMRFIASSVLDFKWLDEVPTEPGDRLLFLAEGLFMYLRPEAVRSIITAIADRFPGAELVAEVASAGAVHMMESRFGRGKMRRQFGLSENVVFKSGIVSSREIEGWAPGLTLLDDWTYYDEDEPKLGVMRFFARWDFIRWLQWTVHYRLGVSSSSAQTHPSRRSHDGA